MILLLLLIQATPSPKLWLARAVVLTTLVATNARTGLVGLAAGAVLTVAISPNATLGRRVARMAGLGLLIPWVAGAILVSRQGSQSVVSGRDTIWTNAANLARQAGLLGHGPGAVARNFSSIGGGDVEISQAQNQYLNDAINFGAIGAVLTIVLLISLLRSGTQSSGRLILVPLGFSLLVVGFSEIPVNLWSSTSQAFPLFLVLLVSSARSSRARHSRSFNPGDP